MRYGVWTALCATLACSGCVRPDADAHLYPISIAGQKAVGNEAWVGIDNVWTEGDALPLADRHCGKYKKIARFRHMEGYRAIFDCIPKS